MMMMMMMMIAQKQRMKLFLILRLIIAIANLWYYLPSVEAFASQYHHHHYHRHKSGTTPSWTTYSNLHERSSSAITTTTVDDDNAAAAAAAATTVSTTTLDNNHDPDEEKITILPTTVHEEETQDQERRLIPKKTKTTLGLLTFDLDDSLYPIEPVLHDANSIFVATMAKYGYHNLHPNDIVECGKRIREEESQLQQQQQISGSSTTTTTTTTATTTTVSFLSHTQVRLEAIRREMEKHMLQRKLQECASDWATEVSSLTTPVRLSAEKWAKAAVSSSIVESIYSAWERERHHSAERHLYSEVLPTLQHIQKQYPNVVIGAITDGKANPKLMVFSLAPYFDFCMSWEDDALGRLEFYKELGSVDGNADLQWIYRAALEKYKDIADSKREMKESLSTSTAATATTAAAKNNVDNVDDDDDENDYTKENVESIWIHVGDDLAYDVGGSASCGAKTILLDLNDEYRQTAKLRFNGIIPSWNTAPEEEINKRKAMNDAAECMVNQRVTRWSYLPEAIEDILKEN